jgi:hypothetical protein
VNDHHDPPNQIPQRDISLLTIIGPIVREGDGVSCEGNVCIFKAQAVLPQVRPALLLVPLELHGLKIHTFCMYVKRGRMSMKSQSPDMLDAPDRKRKSTNSAIQTQSNGVGETRPLELLS